MCAPYECLAKCKFRVKLVPGGQKKGKAAKQVVELLSTSSLCSARCGAALPPIRPSSVTCREKALLHSLLACREKALLKAVPDTEMVAVMIGGVKLSMPGLQKAAQRSKKAKKAG